MSQSEEELVAAYNAAPSLTTLSPLVSLYRSQKDLDKLRVTLLGHYEKFSLSEQFWVDWLSDELKSDRDVYEQLLPLALSDFPLSSSLHRLRLAHCADKLATIEETVQVIGEFDNSFWDEYRKLCPARSAELFRRQLSLPIPDYEAVLGEFQLQLVMDNADPFEASPEVLQIVDLMNLHKHDFQKPSTALALCSLLPRETIFERALVYHPNLPALWASYLGRFPTAGLAARAVRFCPSSGLLWSLRARITKHADLNGFQFITNLAEAQLLLGQLVVIDRPNSIQIIVGALDFPVFSEADGWIWPQLLMEEQLKILGRPVGDRRRVLLAAAERNPENLDIWLRLANFELENEGEQAARDVFERASCSLKLNVPQLMQKWILFETAARSCKLESVVQKMVALSLQSEDETRPDSFERRTVFVANLADGCTEDDLHRLFCQAGEIEGVRLKKKYAFVQFRTADSADCAVKMFSGAVLRGQPLDVKPHQRPQILTLFVKFATSAKPAEVIEFLRENTGITNFKLRIANEPRTDTHGRTNGWGFVDVKSEQDALKFMALSGKIFQAQVVKVEVANQSQKEKFSEKKKNKQKGREEANVLEQNETKTDGELRDFFGLN
jgi:RNA recognition motif-containing protein